MKVEMNQWFSNCVCVCMHACMNVSVLKQKNIFELCYFYVEPQHENQIKADMFWLKGEEGRVK